MTIIIVYCLLVKPSAHQNWSGEVAMRSSVTTHSENCYGK